jgi:hypothetical protein
VNILAAAAKIGFHSTAQPVASLRPQQIAQLEHVYSEAMAAWRQSKETKKSASKRTSRGVALGQRNVLGSAEHETTTQTATEREGDPRFLETALKALTVIRQITGANGLAKALPKRLHDLQRLFLIEATKYNVLPMVAHGHSGWHHSNVMEGKLCRGRLLLQVSSTWSAGQSAC